MSTKQQPLRIHLVLPDETGPIVSEPAGKPVPISTGGRYRIACDPKLVLTERDRGTGEPCLVACKACRALLAGELAHLDRPHPRDVEASDFAEE